MVYISGKVQHGKKLGRTIGFPTINIPHTGTQLEDGVYVCDILIASDRYKGVGTYLSHKRLIEVHIFDFDDDIYDMVVIVFLGHKIRDNRLFSSKQELTTQLTKDAKIARTHIQRNIALFHPYLLVQGGANKMMLHLAHALEDQGHSVTLYVYQRDMAVYPELCRGLTIVTLDAASSLSRLTTLISTIRGLSDTSEIFIGNSPMHMVGYIAKRIYKIHARVYWWHHHVPWLSDPTDLSRIRRLKRYIERKFFIPSIDTMLASSTYLAGIVSVYTQAQTKILSPIVDDIFLSTDTTVRSDTDILQIFLHTRLEKTKGVQDLIQLCRLLQSNKIPFQCRIAGVGSYKDVLSSMIYDLPQVQFIGQISPRQIIQELDTADVFFLPSKIESFGMSAIEAAARNCRIYCYDIPALRESLSGQMDIHFVESTIEIVDDIKKNQGNLHTNHTKMSNKLSTVQYTHTYTGFSSLVKQIREK